MEEQINEFIGFYKIRRTAANKYRFLFDSAKSILLEFLINFDDVSNHKRKLIWTQIFSTFLQFSFLNLLFVMQCIESFLLKGMDKSKINERIYKPWNLFTLLSISLWNYV